MESEERNDLGPGPAPALADGRVFPAPWAGFEGRQRRFAAGRVDRPVDVLQRRRDRLAVLVGDEVQAVAQQMDDAGLNRRFGKDGDDRLRKALQAIDDGDEYILDAAVFQLVHDPQPEFGAFVLLEPQAENLLGAVGADAERDMHRLVADQPFVADFDPQGSKKTSG